MSEVTLDVSHPSIAEGRKAVENRKTAENWCAFHFEEGTLADKKPTIVPAETVSGDGGIEELREHLKSSHWQMKISCGMFLVKCTDTKNKVGEIPRDKFVAFLYVGSAVNEVDRSRLLLYKNGVWKMFNSHKTIDYRGDEIDSLFTADGISKSMHDSGAAHKPDQYDFGGGKIIKFSTTQDKDDEDEDSESFD